MRETKERAVGVAFLQRLTEMAERHAGGNWSRFAQQAGLKQQTLHGVKQGGMPRADNLRRLCEHYDISADWLLLGRQLPPVQTAGSAHSHDALARGVALDAGEIGERIRTLPERLAIPKAHLRMAVVDDDQMAPTLTKGGIVVFTTRFKADAGLHAMREKAGAPLLYRRIVRAASADRYRLLCDNPKYPEEHASAATLRNTVKGRVVWFETYPD